MGRITSLLGTSPESLMPRPAHRLFPLGNVQIIALIATMLVAGCQLGQQGGGAAAKGDVTPNAVTGDAIEVMALDAQPTGTPANGDIPQAGADTGMDTGAADDAAPPQTIDPAAGAAALDPAADPAPQPDVAPVAETPVDPAATTPVAPKPEQQVLCEKRGGRWSGVGSGILRICVYPTRDDGKQCDRESDCEGVCLARSRTCAPVDPLLGCNEILQDNGARVTLCIE